MDRLGGSAMGADSALCGARETAREEGGSKAGRRFYLPRTSFVVAAPPRAQPSPDEVTDAGCVQHPSRGVVVHELSPTQGESPSLHELSPTQGESPSLRDP
jgi:hypothetical protein